MDNQELQQNTSIKEKVAIITGASQGIGMAIAQHLYELGAHIGVGSRSVDKLQSLYPKKEDQNRLIQYLDLADQGSIESFIDEVQKTFGQVDVFVHCGGMYADGYIRETDPSTFDALYNTNVKGAFLLVRGLLPYFNPALSQVVVVNSSTALSGKANVGPFSAVSHALKALTDAFRQENNANRIRVMSAFLGRTATPRMEKLYQKSGNDYRPELLIQPKDVAATIAQLLSLPITAEVTNIHIRPFIKSY